MIIQVCGSLCVQIHKSKVILGVSFVMMRIKQSCFVYLPMYLSSECESDPVCTSLEGAITNSPTLDLSTLQPCTQEEADTHMFVHA